MSSREDTTSGGPTEILQTSLSSTYRLRHCSDSLALLLKSTPALLLLLCRVRITCHLALLNSRQPLRCPVVGFAPLLCYFHRQIQSPCKGSCPTLIIIQPILGIVVLFIKSVFAFQPTTLSLAKLLPNLLHQINRQIQNGRSTQLPHRHVPTGCGSISFTDGRTL